MLSGCNEKGQNNGATEVVHDTVYVRETATEPEAAITASEEESADGPTGSIPAEAATAADPFDSVNKWVVTVTSVTTLYEPISAAEAKRLERELADNDERWVEYDEVDQCYYLRGHSMVETGKKTITNAKHVSRLNALMGNPDFKEYRDEVTIRNNTAYARWYGGNRGGGIDEEFPSDLAKLFF